MQTGDAFDVKVHPIVKQRTRLGTFEWQTDMSYELTNALPRPVIVKLLQQGLVRDSRVTAESLKSVRPDAQTAEWDVTVPANGKVTLTASFDTRF